MKERTALVAAGLALGLSGAFAMGRAFGAMLACTFGQRSGDTVLGFGATLVLAALAMLACYLPARRASEIDPMAALREE